MFCTQFIYRSSEHISKHEWMKWMNETRTASSSMEFDLCLLIPTIYICCVNLHTNLRQISAYPMYAFFLSLCFQFHFSFSCIKCKEPGFILEIKIDLSSTEFFLIFPPHSQCALAMHMCERVCVYEQINPFTDINLVHMYQNKYVSNIYTNNNGANDINATWRQRANKYFSMWK